MKHSNSYLQFREKTQEIFNFAVLVTASVPSLKQNIGKYRKNELHRLPDPDFFEPSVIYEISENTIAKLTDIEVSKIEQLNKLVGKPFGNKEFKNILIEILGEPLYKRHRNILKTQSLKYVDNILECTKNYQSKLATYLYFSLFSYFEAFIIDLSKEMIDSLPSINGREYIENFESDTTKKLRSQLNGAHDSRKEDRYKKISRELNLKGYKPPKDILSDAIIKLLTHKIDNLKANDIPNFLENTFYIYLSEEEKETFHSIRDNRNSIAHGKKLYTPIIRDVISANKFFKSLSLKIDNQVINYFFGLNNYMNL